jgi:hypothetical protein
MLKWQDPTYIVSVHLTFHTAAVTMIVEFPTDKLYVYMDMLYIYIYIYIYVCVCVYI